MSEAHLRTRLAYLGVLLAAVLCYAALGAVVALLPRYVSERLGGGPTLVGLAVGAPALTGLIGRPLGGRAADRHGPLLPLLIGAGVMAVGAVPAALVTDAGGLLLSRLVVGMGEGVMMGSCVLWLLRLAGQARQGRALGHVGLANYAGLAIGPLLAASLGGVRESNAVFWLAAALPLSGAATALGAARISSGPVESANAGPTVLPSSTRPRCSTGTLIRKTAPAGGGLLLVNVGYVSLLAFGAAIARENAAAVANLIVPVFAGIIIVSRTIAAGVPDRLGGRRTVMIFAGAEALGLLAFALAGTAPLELAALLALSVGQSLAVPGLGLLALSEVPADAQGTAAGLFFAWFDAGVGLGGLAIGAVASLTGSSGALVAAAAAVSVVVLIAYRASTAA